MDYDSPSRIKAVIETMQAVERVRATERAMIDTLMNGKRPYTDEEVKKHQIRINVNWNEGNNILQDGNRQVNNATLWVGKFFTATCNQGPMEKRDEWSQKFTKNINKILKKKKTGKRHMFLRKGRNASIVLHGIGPLMWMAKDDWLARFIPLEDLLIPTDTTLDLCNLQHFCVNLYLTQTEFFDLYNGPDKGWNKPMCNSILDALKVQDSNQTYDLSSRPEEWAEEWKQNRSFYNSDKVPRVQLRMFLFQDPKDKKWYRRVILRENPGTKLANLDQDMSSTFVYTSKVAFADDIDHILHVQFGDCSIVPPLKYHSVRGLGTLLYGVIEIMNRLHCQNTQAAFDDLMPLLRVQNPTDRARQQIVQLFPYAVVEDGASFVKKDERHVPDQRLVESVMSQGRQNMSENSNSFVQDINDGTGKEMTATEANARIQQVNVMVGGMLQAMYGQEEFYFEEVVRRFLMRNPTDETIIAFRKQCREDGIPEEAMDIKFWDIDIERVLGAGDQALAQQESTALLTQSQRFDPTSQRKILHKWVGTITRNPDLATDLVPMKEPEATDGTFMAEDVFATLMEGIPISMREGIDQQGYIEAMIGMMAAKVGKIEEAERAGQTPELDELEGLDNVQQDITQHIQLLAQNPENNQLVKQYQDALGQLNNMVKKFIQHYQEANQDTSGIDKESEAKANATMMLAQVKAQAGQANAAQKLQQNQQKFEQRLQQDMTKSQVKMQQELERHMMSMRQQMEQMQADLITQGAKVQADLAGKVAMNKVAAEAKESSAPKE